MFRPIIGIVGRVTKTKDNDEAICAWDEIRKSIITSGGMPLLILPSKKDYKKSLSQKEKDSLFNIVDLCNGIVFQGGNKWYEYDVAIYKYALDNDLPILGICAGMQMMACVDKYDTSQDLTISNNTYINHNQKDKKYVHNIKVINNSLLYDIVRVENMKVNSRHNYHIDGVKNFKISAYSEDGIIEAIEYPDKEFVLGVQWHPESIIDCDKYAKRIFLKFIKICQKNALFY